MNSIRSEYRFKSSEAAHTHAYLMPAVEKVIRALKLTDRRIFEVGCGNGAAAQRLCELGYEVTAIDASRSGIQEARRRAIKARFEERSAYDELSAEFGQYPLVISLEVVEHVFEPRAYARNVFNLVSPGGVALISTPYHGYFKNLAIAIAGRFDSHWGPLWEGGHIKFWSEATLRRLLSRAGFSSIDFVRVGRVPVLARSMIAIARRPADT